MPGRSGEDQYREHRAPGPGEAPGHQDPDRKYADGPGHEGANEDRPRAGGVGLRPAAPTHGDPAQVRQPRDLGPDVPGQVGGARAQHRPHAGVTGYAGGATREKGCCMLRRLQSWARSWRTWALLLLFGLLVAWAGRFLWAEYHLRAARHALERRAYPEARAHLDRYLQVWPRSPTAHLLAARCA